MRYEALSRGLDALLREHQIQTSPLNKAIKSPGQSEVFRRTIGQVSRKYWATVSAEEKRLRGQRSTHARWKGKTSVYFPNVAGIDPTVSVLALNDRKRRRLRLQLLERGLLH